jgi:hypothetical protein
VSDGEDTDSQTFTINVTATAVAGFVVFDTNEKAGWPAWDCCGGSSPTIVVDEDPAHGDVMEFTIVGSTVVGFTSRAVDGAVGGVPYDATPIAANGTIEFDLKLITPPITVKSSAATDWKLKLESNSGATALEISLSTSIEGHLEPEVGVWQHYTFNIADLAAGGLDISEIDVIMIFPLWGAGDGAVFRVDNLSFFANDGETPPPAADSLTIFTDAENPDWVLWDCCGGSTPTVETDDSTPAERLMVELACHLMGHRYLKQVYSNLK